MIHPVEPPRSPMNALKLAIGECQGDLLPGTDVCGGGSVPVALQMSLGASHLSYFSSLCSQGFNFLRVFVSQLTYHLPRGVFWCFSLKASEMMQPWQAPGTVFSD